MHLIEILGNHRCEMWKNFFLIKSFIAFWPLHNVRMFQPITFPLDQYSRVWILGKEQMFSQMYTSVIKCGSTVPPVIRPLSSAPHIKYAADVKQKRVEKCSKQNNLE